jgi:hypothetical protein
LVNAIYLLLTKYVSPPGYPRPGDSTGDLDDERAVVGNRHLGRRAPDTACVRSVDQDVVELTLGIFGGKGQRGRQWATQWWMCYTGSTARW